MKTPKWKHWLSYLMEVHLESSSSEHNEYLHVSLNKGRLQLSTANAIYSYADKYENFYKIFEQIKLNDSIEDVLILGFGLGSIPYMLEEKFGKEYCYTGVEIDEEVIYLASKYVLSDLKSEVMLIEADAINYIHQCTQTFDLICIDIFVDDQIPDVFLTSDFLHLVKDSLTDSGLVVFNHLADRSSYEEKARNYFKDVFKDAFPDGQYLQVLGNGMMVSC